MVYQPIVDKGFNVVVCESLMRWKKEKISEKREKISENVRRTAADSWPCRSQRFFLEYYERSTLNCVAQLRPTP